ncbi:MAG: DUF927 domain-containing protein [Candidatus Wallbacteria bacterium]
MRKKIKNAEKFFSMIFRGINEGCVAIWCKKSKATKFFKFNELEDAATYALACSEEDDVYFSVCALKEGIENGRGKVSDVTAVMCFWADIDVGTENHSSKNYPESIEKAIEIFKELKIMPTMVVNSGGGLHMYFLLNKPFFITNEEERTYIQDLSSRFQQRLIALFGDFGYKVDNTADLARVLRVIETQNHKNAIVKPVELFEINNEIKYCISDIETLITKSSNLCNIEPPAETPEQIKNYSLIEKSALAEAIIQKDGCKWAIHCRDQAVTLPEPEWFNFLTVIANCSDGQRLAHEYSKKYPNYSVDETNKKLEYIISNNYKPVTCETVKKCSQVCQECQLNIKSPINLGYNSKLISMVKDNKIIQDAVHKLKLTQNTTNFYNNKELLIALFKKRNKKNWSQILKCLNNYNIKETKLNDFFEEIRFKNDFINAVMKQNNYFIDSEGYLCKKVTDKENNEKVIRLANFVPIPEKRVVYSDGIEASTKQTMSAILKGTKKLPSIFVDLNDFQKMQWPCVQWGIELIIYRGMSNDVKEFIQLLSEYILVERYTFTHTGWHKYNDKWIYLHGGGAIGAENINVELDDYAKNYAFLDFECNIKQALETVFNIFNIGCRDAMMTLLAGTYLAPLLEIERQEKIKEAGFIIWLYGNTGTRKTTIASLMLSHFGLFNNPPASFKDTANSIEVKGFTLKDTLLLIDDYRSSSSSETENMEAVAQTVLRKYGDRIGRGRMDSNIQHRKSYPPRGIAIVTGEDKISGESSVARCIEIELRGNEINLEVLSDIQHNSKNLEYVMKNYITWLSSKFDTMGSIIKDKFYSYRQEILGNGIHGRFAEAVAHLRIGFETFIDFVMSCDCLEIEEAEKLKNEAAETFKKIVIEQNRSAIEENQTVKFINSFREMLQSGIISIKKINAQNTNSYENIVGLDIDDDFIYVWPQILINKISRFYKTESKIIGISSTMLYKNLDEQGFILTQKSKKGNVDRTPKKDIKGYKRSRYLWFFKKKLFPDSDTSI